MTQNQQDSIIKKKYVLKQPKEQFQVNAPVEGHDFAEHIQVSDYKDMSIVEKLLALRNIIPENVEGFLNPDFDSQTHDPFLLKDMGKSVERILKAIDSNEKILIYSDYDADGIPGAAIAHDFFNTIAYPNVEYIAPDRHEKGFGLHADVVEPYIDKGHTLVITIDCGISDVKPSKAIIDYGKEKYDRQIDLIITDHHLPHDVVPVVFAIINPKQSECNYPEKMLCGAAVMYKLVCALVLKLKELEHPLAAKFLPGYDKWLLDLVGIATLSDMVPLLGENRTLAHYGLIVLRKTKRPGLLLLCRTNMIEKSNILEEDVTFTMAPRINVASRLASPELAFKLLTTSDWIEADALAKQLNSINTKRKTMVAQTMKHAHHSIKEKGNDSMDVLVVGNPDWKPPILGLVATQLIRAHKKPVFVWGRGDDGLLKGSVRSIDGVDIVELMNGTREGLFVNKGGHAMSGGFSITTEHVIDLESELNRSFAERYGNDEKVIDEDGHLHKVDLEVRLEDININLYQQLMRVSPFGMANEKPTFAIRDIGGIIARKFGKAREHLELDLGSMKAIQFFTEYTDEGLAEIENLKNPTIIGQIELNQFRGAKELRIKLIDII